MKTKLFLFLTVAFIFSSCAPNKFYSRKWLGDVPARVSQAPIQIFYPTDPLPKKPYFEVLRMDVALKGARTSKKLVEELQKSALFEGVDAVIVLDASNDTLAYTQNRMIPDFDLFDNDPNISEGYINGVFYEMISGIGIKYLHNIDYMNSLIKNEELYLVHDTLNAPYLLANIDYYPSGSVKDFRSIHPRAENLFVQHIKPYARYYLLYDQNGKWHEWFVENRLTRREKYRLDDWMVKRVNVYYDTFHKEQRIVIRYNEGKFPYTEVIKLIREDGKVHKRVIDRHNDHDLIEKYTYDSQNNIIARDIYQLVNGEEKHFFKSIFSYYSKEDLHELLNQDKKLLHSPQ
ncbi:MAG: hypothetical protein ACOCWM_00060 [Cyclobacteriaceae bacterium]